MGSGNSQYPLTYEYLFGEPLRTGLVPVPPVEDRFHERVAAGHHIADDPQVGHEAQLVRAVAFDQFDAERGELIAHRRIDVGVAAGDPESGLLRDRRDSAHEGAADAENVEMHCERSRTTEAGDCTRGLRYHRAANSRPRLTDPKHRFNGKSLMGRNNARQNGMRAQIAAAAARIMAEEGVEDFALAKRKAARRLGATDTEAPPSNGEIEAELRAYPALYQADEHPR